MYKTAKYFHTSEFLCRCGCATPTECLTALKALIMSLQVLRIKLGRPVIINSGYRCPAHNYAVGGSSRSFHMSGMAGDIVVPGMSPGLTAKHIENLMVNGEMLKGGLKAYSNFVHYDIRGVITKF